MKKKKAKGKEKKPTCTVSAKIDAIWYFMAQYLYLLSYYCVDDDEEFMRRYHALTEYVNTKLNDALPAGEVLGEYFVSEVAVPLDEK